MIIIDSVLARETSISSTATAGAREMATPRSFWIAHAVTIATGIGLQLVGLYAATVAFGGWVTLALYVVGGLAVLLRHLVVWRGTSCSPGD